MKTETNKRIKLIRAVSIVLAAAVVVAVLLVLGPILEPKYLDIREGSLTATPSSSTRRASSITSVPSSRALDVFAAPVFAPAIR